ncbi:rod shape-determining protein MreC [Clostridium estertheticum]|uniref:rod shape-determining protein MreC n=1 Tax=Clostridium estertheticum TaxID=238834 RepID=UPI001C0ABD17|nr:rod shape-determining protein MreC [Clostridium estertheticum]MBU3176684.1 rod shape-determining protein MreC [Clostridium estertheticum]
MKFLKNKLAVVIILLSVTFLSLIGYSVNREKMSFVENGVGVTINSVQGVFFSGFFKIKSSFKFITNISNVKTENEELRKTNSELQSKVIEYSSLIKKNERVSKIFKFSDKNTQYTYIGADINGLVANSFSNGFSINKGEKSGIKKGMVAITGDGLVGQVESVGDNRSIVQCLSNENIAVAGLVDNTRDNGIVKGYTDANNKSLAQIQRLSLESKIKKGNVIVTSGLGGKYPSGIRIGSVLSVHEDKGAVMKGAIIKPYVDFSKLEEVFIVVPTDTKTGEIKY